MQSSGSKLHVWFSSILRDVEFYSDNMALDITCLRTPMAPDIFKIAVENEIDFCFISAWQCYSSMVS